jgi:diadenosine tetraphosphate (Ap4A) HIT family hydrolase
MTWPEQRLRQVLRGDLPPTRSTGTRHVCFLDIMPALEGHALVITKEGPRPVRRIA